MSSVDSFVALRTALDGDTITTYKIYCYSKESLKNIIATFEQKVDLNITRPRVFISYAGNDQDNSTWVKQLAVELRKNGIDARLDVFHLKPGFDLPYWMTNEVIQANKVILVCDSHYMQKADFRKGGVGWETMIIQGDMLTQGDNKQKYIAIVREKDVDEALPIYLRSKYALRWGKTPIAGEQLRELILHLFDCDIEPELGPIPTYVAEKLKRAKAI